MQQKCPISVHCCKGIVFDYKSIARFDNEQLGLKSRLVFLNANSRENQESRLTEERCASLFKRMVNVKMNAAAFKKKRVAQ